jgi:CheY-like chemotaxis protein
MAAGLLAKRGHIVTLATNGAEAVDLYENRRFDLILMDVRMPVMDGFEATAEIRGKEVSGGSDRVSIIALTADELGDDPERFMASGMDGVLPKPFRPHELFDVVEACRPPTGTDVSKPEACTTAADPPGRGSPGASARMPASPDAGVRDSAPLAYDRVQALSRCGSEEVLRDMVALFLQERPALMDDIRGAVDHGDPSRLELASHTLKGAVQILAAHQAVEAARCLERMGKEGDLSRCEAAWTRLQQEIRRLQAALEP